MYKFLLSATDYQTKPSTPIHGIIALSAKIHKQNQRTCFMDLSVMYLEVLLFLIPVVSRILLLNLILLAPLPLSLILRDLAQASP